MKITIYTITDCQFSKQEKEYLAAHNLPYEERNLETNHEYLTEMLNVSNNFAGTPVTKLEKEDGTVVILKGFTTEEFDKELGFKKEEVKTDTAEAQSKETKSDQPDKTAAPDQSQQAAPPTSPPEIPAPKPPSPVPEPAAPQPPTPETPVVPPIVPDQNLQNMNVNAAPSIPMEPNPPATDPTSTSPPQTPPPADPAQPTENSVDDASLDAILSQLQEKTSEQKKSTPPPAGSPPNVPDFGTSS